MKKIFTVCIVMVSFSLLIGQDAFSQQRPAEKCTQIMDGIDRDIRSLKNSYEELSNFSDNNYYSAQGAEEDCEKRIIRYGTLGRKNIPFIDIGFRSDSCKHSFCSMKPVLETYMKEADKYLIAVVVTENDNLKKSIIEIVERNAKAAQ